MLQKYFENFKNYVLEDKYRKYFVGASLALLAILVVASVLNFSKKTIAYVSIDGEQIGVFDVTGIEVDLNQVKEDVTNYGETVEGAPVKIVFPKLDIVYENKSFVPSSQLVEYESFLGTLYELSQPSFVSYGIYVDNVLIGGGVKEEEDLNKILEDIKAIYNVPQMEGTITNISFQENVQVKQIVSKDKNYVEPQVVYDALRQPIIVEVNHEVVEGDSLWQIAWDNDLPLDTLLGLNPTFSEDNYLQIGDILRLENEKPLLSTVTTERVEYQGISYRDIETIENPEEYKTWSQVIQEGSDGESYFTVDIGYTDGNEKNREVIQEVVIVPSVAQIMEIGTLDIPPTKAIGTFIWPTSGPISDVFGARGGNHFGTDIAVPTGTPIYACDGGYVEFAGWQSGFGNLVIIDHENGFKTYYGHNSRFQVSQGERVRQGQVIASAGSTGRSTGPHCHIEVRINGVPHNPQNYLGGAYQ
ncbi:MAG: peptidoglycan DD-metalloendopeptidase family protein [Lachnospirales bacterium]